MVSRNRDQRQARTVAGAATFRTIAAAIRFWAEYRPETPVFSFHSLAEEPEFISFAELELSALKVASKLQLEQRTGPALLLYAVNSPDFIRAFFGCILQGVPAVPLPLP